MLLIKQRDDGENVMKLSLDHLESFVTAAETGSFSAAGRKLGKAQSAVSTAIANLEIDLDVQLFDRSDKYPVLTGEGEILLRDARTILMRCTDLQNHACGFSEDVDARIRIAVDEIIPHSFFIDLLNRFGEEFPDTELEILYGALSDIQTLVIDDRTDIGLLVPIDFPDKRLVARRIAYMTFCPVVSAKHPLAEKKDIGQSDLEPYRQLSITSRGGERVPDAILFSSRSWIIENSYVIRDLVLRGMGYSFLPRHLVQDDLDSDRLVWLPLESEKKPYQTPIYLISAPSRSFGKAGTWLMDEFTKMTGG